MNRTDRLLAIILELQGRGWCRAEDLAAIFETSKRTIYRDIQALSEAGVPLISVPGQGYSLVEGYFLPPLSFSIDEATMLLLGAEVVAQHFDAEYRAAAEWAGRKITGVLPESVRDQVDQVKGSFFFVPKTAPDQAAYLQQLRRAILRRQTVRFCYTTRYGDDPSPHQREADPYGLVHTDGAWILTAYCHLRQEMRVFRLSRMADLVVLPETFIRPPGYKVGERRPSADSRQVTVCVLIDDEAARWVEEDRFFFITDRQQAPDGLLVTLRVRQEREILQWLLSWGRHLRVLEPESLRDLVAQEAQAMLDHHRVGELT
jgi:predicted DNA-binding transcriptional regulator YafY